MNAVRDLIRGIDYESWLFETSGSPKAAEMRMKNVNTLFQWMTEMLEGSDIEMIKTATEHLTEVSYNAFGKVYQQQAAQQQAGQQAGGANYGAQQGGANEPHDDNVVDADYEVVDDNK